MGYGVAGCEPTIMGIGPVPSIQAMLEKTGVSLGEVDQVGLIAFSRPSFQALLLFPVSFFYLPKTALAYCLSDDPAP